MTQETIETPDAAEAPAPPAALVSPEVPRLGVPFGASRSIPGEGRPSFVFLVLVSIVSLVSDIATKLWAEKNLDGYPGIVNVWENHVAFVLAKNRGGAWGLLQGTSENVRRPFFLLVSAAAIAFIVTLYRRLQPTQRALKWGLPLVLGGALGNVFDRIRYGHVIDFIDVHVAWRESEHRWWWPTSNAQFPLIEHHWPTFNVADVAICVGVGLMAIDMFTSKKPMAPAQPTIVPEPGKVPELDKAPEPEIAPEVVSSGAPTPETKSAD